MWQNLKHLNLFCAKFVTDPTLASLSQLQNLIFLNVSKCRITDEGMKIFHSPILRLQYLYLDECSISEEGIYCLKSQTQLKHLSLLAKITDENLIQFANTSLLK